MTANKAQKMEMLFLAIDKASPKIDLITKKMQQLTNTVFTTQRKFTTMTGAINASMAKRNGWTDILNTIPRTIGESTKKLGGFDLVVKKTARNLEEMTAKAKKFDMRMLSILFAGMALQRAFGGALRSIHNSFVKAENKSSALSQATMGLNAAWEFLKFSIFNALDQPGIRNFIRWIIDIVNWTSDLINKYPALGAAIVAAFGVLAATGSVGMVVAQFALGWKSLFGIGGIFATSAAKTATSVSTSFTNTFNKLQKALGALTLAWTIKLVFDDIKDMQFDPLDNVLTGVMTTIGLKMLGKGWALKGGIWTFVVLTAIEMILDPSGFGSFLVTVANYATRTIETVGEIIRAFLFTIKDIFSGKGVSLGRFDSTQIKNWFTDYYKGAEKEILKLEQEGELSHTLQKSWSRQIEAAKLAQIKTPSPVLQSMMVTWTQGGQGFNQYNAELNVLTKNLPTANNLMSKMQENVTKVDDALVTKSLVPSMSMLNQQFAIANEDKMPVLIENMEMLTISVDRTTESVDLLTEAINNIPSEKTITIRTVRIEEEESSTF